MRQILRGVGRIVILSGAALATIVLASCGTTERRTRLVAYATERESQFTAAQMRQIERNCGQFGMPKKVGSFGGTDYVTHDGYVLEHSRTDRIPIWVAERLDAGQWEGNAKRPAASAWRADPTIDPEHRAEKSDYNGSGYTRGHMAPNADFGTYEARFETFILSNAVPQDGTQNSGVWSTLEGKVRGLMDARGGGYAITGPMFYEAEDDPETGSGGDGVIDYFTIGTNQVAVPTHTFKIFVVPTPGGMWEGYGIVIENSPQFAPYRWSEYARSIDWIERRTGLNFLPALTGADEAQVEGVKRVPPF